MVLSNFDGEKGRYINTNQPTARHTYNLTLIRGRRFYMLAARGMPDHLSGMVGGSGADNGVWGGRICWYDFDTPSWTYSKHGSAYASPPNVPWYFASGAALDPVSQKILVVGPNPQAGAGAMWLYDPDSDSIATGPACNVGLAADVVYFPPNDRFYVLQSEGSVWEITLNRAMFAASTIVPLVVTGTRPASEAGILCAYAYDTVNKIIGGNVANGVFYAFDPLTKSWSSRMVLMEDRAAESPTAAYHCLEFDPVSGCFVFLGNAKAAGSTVPRTWAYRYAAPATVATTSDVRNLEVALDFGGGSIAIFSGANAVDKGDFVGEFVHQKCYLAKDQNFPDWRVWLRPDADGTRDEVVVEYGRSVGGIPATWATPYTATIRKNGTPVYTVTVPSHNWYARWRYQSSPRPVVRPPSVLRQRGWIPNFGTTGMLGGGADTLDIAWPGPMQNPPQTGGAFMASMAVGGDHDDIGYLTEQAASYMMFEAPQNLSTLRTQGEWCGNWPMHIRDDSGGMLSCRDLSTFFKDTGGTINNDPVGRYAPVPGWVYIESAHWYPCANAPWMLTDDPFMLEEFQFGVNWRILWNKTPRQHEQLGGIFYPGEIRSYAWGLRDLFQLTASCPDSVPAWLKPKSYWQGCVDDNKTFAMRFVNSPARLHALFRSWPISAGDAPWQNAWLSAVVGMAIEQGFTDWLPIFKWSIDKQIQMSNGTSGWNRQWPVPYATLLNSAAIPDDLGRWWAWSDISPDATTPANWAAYWEFYKSGGLGYSDQDGHTIDSSTWDGHTLMAPYYDTQGGKYNFAGYSSYFLHLRSALAVAVRRGITGAQGCYDYLHGEMLSAFANVYRVKGQARFSIDP
jgi:hypothetical protein